MSAPARILLTLSALLAVALPASPAVAQEATTRPDRESVPEIGEVMRLMDKATAPEEDAEGNAENGSWSGPIRLALIFGLLAMLPAMLVMMTAFTRIVIVLGFIRRALTTQNIPPNIAIIGLALFLTLFTMAPTFGRINQSAVEPYMAGQMSFDSTLETANGHMKGFMVQQTREGDLTMFLEMAGITQVETAEDVPMHVMIPAFTISEFRTAFEMGCLLFIPFLLIDLVVGGILLSAGMMMLPPAMVSLPLKIILFVLVDGWSLIAQALVDSFIRGGP
ncbi:MAG: flagellar type III secretion system pore protein FliP [Phycisphaerae bacterium]